MQVSINISLYKCIYLIIHKLDNRLCVTNTGRIEILAHPENRLTAQAVKLMDALSIPVQSDPQLQLIVSACHWARNIWSDGVFSELRFLSLCAKSVSGYVTSAGTIGLSNSKSIIEANICIATHESR